MKWRDIYFDYFKPEYRLEETFKYFWRHVSKLPKKRGDIVFTQPPQPFKCGGAPQKIMHMVAADFEKNGGLKR